MDKRIIAFLVSILLFRVAFAQDESDALRYSYLTPGGTARMQAVGGTGISLGGDAGDITLNPAGIGLFRTSDLSITPGLKAAGTSADYLNTSATDSKIDLHIQQLGLIIASDKKRGSDTRWQNFTFGIGLNRMANFNNNVYFQGINKNSSYSEQYLEQLINDKVTNPNDAAKNYPYGASLAFNTFLIDTLDNASGNMIGYQSYVPVSNGILQQNTVSTKGGLNEFALAFAGNYDNKFYIGLGLGIPSIKFSRVNTYSESITKSNGNNGFQNFSVTNNLSTTGVGINGKIGLIYMVSPLIRVGGAFYSPTSYSMHDNYSTSMITNTGNFQGVQKQSSTDLNSGYPGEYNYSLTTPWRAMGGISFIFGTSPDIKQQHGFLNIDYEFVNYGSARYRFNGSNSTPSDQALANSLDHSISSMYKGASNIRVGGELKFNIFYVRAGFDWMGSPYSDTNIKGQQTRYSAGIGLRSKGIYTDLTYIYANRGDQYYPYVLQDKAVSPADLTYNASNIVFTIGFKL
ncbi:MAG: hypothetical protein EPN37_02185 [Chitinophagaceae bacterium]|nr:MAG: hypothetical protein EPN37_02185 [Chitinophagaceae bacterium]